MRSRSFLVAAVAAALLITVPATADAAAKRPYKVSVSSIAAGVDVGTTLTFTGKVSGPKAAKKAVVLQRRLGSGPWRAVATGRTTKSRAFTLRTKVGATGSQSFRVYAAASTKAKAGVSATRATTGWRWIDLTREPLWSRGEVNAASDATVQGKLYRDALLMDGGAVYPVALVHPAKACDRVTYGLALDDTSGAATATLYQTLYPDSSSPALWTESLVANRNSAPTPVSRSLVGGQYLQLLSFTGDYRFALISPRLHCSMDHLPKIPNSELTW